MYKVRTAIYCLLLGAACQITFAAPQLHDLSINVVLGANGDAHITETRHMSIDSEGTEVYVVIGNLDSGSTIRNMSVTDESGQIYVYTGAWDVDRSRDEKTGQCGIVTKSDGYELCWGLGRSGERTYILSYTVTNMVRSYADSDGFNYMFVAPGLNPLPEHVRLSLTTAEGSPLSTENAAIWAFRYEGDVTFQDGNIVAETFEPFSRRSAMIVMVQLQKGLLQPALQQTCSFEDVKTRAFEGSDYTDDDDTWALIMLLFFLLLIPLLFIAYIVLKWWQRRGVMKDLDWWRDIPLGGKLQEANIILNNYRYFTSDYNNLLSACVLRLINVGAISIEPATDAKGEMRQNFVIHPLPDADSLEPLVRSIHNIFLKAAGSDTILEPEELRTWMQSSANQSAADSFVQRLHAGGGVSLNFANSAERDNARKLFGLRKYLKDFSLIDERHLGELTLWKDYMIYATLFGISDQVIRDMKKINPDYFNIDQVASQMADDMTLPTINYTFTGSAARAWVSRAERQARASGGGGHASWGGGGGFSGGGFGGGVR